jgi:hypothetical protein
MPNKNSVEPTGGPTGWCPYEQRNLMGSALRVVAIVNFCCSGKESHAD